MSRQPRRHHVVPRTLLSRFASEAGGRRIWALDLNDGRIISMGINDATVVGDFYSWLHDDGSRHTGIEEWMGQQPEADIGAILDELEATGQSGAELQQKLLLFILLQLLRTTLGRGLLRFELRQQFERLYEIARAGDSEATVTAIRDYIGDLKHRDATPQELGDWLLRIPAEAFGLAAPTEPSRNALITHIARTLFPRSGEPLVQMLDQCRISVYRSTEDTYVISDTPATFAEIESEALVSDWVEQPPSSLSLPISPHSIVEVRRRSDPLPHDDAEATTVANTLNFRTVAFAERWVFASDPDLLADVRDAAPIIRSAHLCSQLQRFRLPHP